ncbi:hypothetical protein Slin15195_G095750 [Septoria linicola]|uniref:Uncharacterized protein n=1 Tax=Septoria linicola TaxID=215465 RepID=A0A9Q9B2X2_9PEZI|nr:hypothetical protein Slin14017_G058840 [Septoria linicola]USW56256.1 hypothetical protein Slin15195_G095750 [Septoria linicola]
MASERQSTEPMATPDSTRSATGAWLLPGDLWPRVAELEAQDPTLSLTRCLKFWEPNGAKTYSTSLMLNLIVLLDPMRTQRTVEDGTIWYCGGWMMNISQKEEYDRLLAANPTWTHTRCYRAAVGGWNSGVSQAVAPEYDVQFLRLREEAAARTEH